MDKKLSYDKILQKLNESEKQIRELKNELSDSQQHLKEKSEFELSLQNKIADIFLNEADEQLFKKILELALEVTQSKYGMFGYINDSGAMVYPYIQIGVYEQCGIKTKSCIFYPEDWTGLWGRSLIEKKILYSNSPVNVPEAHIPILRALTCPIIYHEELIGHLHVANKSKDYNEQDKKTIEAFSNYLAPILYMRIQSNKQKSEREKLEKQLRQAQKMEAIGTLAGGIAHDFNNILSPIIGYTEMTMVYCSEDSDICGNLEQILKAANRAKELVKQILTFSRWSESEKKTLNIKPIIKEALQLLRASLPTTIEIKKSIKDCGLIISDPTQINQIIVNLCTNAYHAMEPNGGKLIVSLNEILLSEEDVDVLLECKAGRYAKLSVTDTGHGMPKQTIERIFDPYFTTKDATKGTGLGLAIVHGIVKNHNGFIRVYSEINKGSTFDIYIPIIEDKTKPKQTKIDRELIQGSERILFIDDEEQLVAMAQRMLSYLGYKVTSFTDPLIALKMFKEKPFDFDIVITDVTMPHITGINLAKKLIEIKPNIPIILCTGFTELITEEEAKKMGIKELVPKPFLQSQLSKIIRKLIENN
ncbi:MAG: response regulator [Desulfobacterales bacterium]|nr:response regulator [Desulfobacterales bacterium]